MFQADDRDCAVFSHSVFIRAIFAEIEAIVSLVESFSKIPGLAPLPDRQGRLSPLYGSERMEIPVVILAGDDLSKGVQRDSLPWPYADEGLFFLLKLPDSYSYL